MKFRAHTLSLFFVGLFIAASSGFLHGAAESRSSLPGRRIPWTTSRVIGSPEPPAPYRVEPVFPKLKKFVEPLEFAAMPGSDRVLVVEHESKIFSFPNDPNCAQADLFADMKQLNPEVKEVYSVAFHPQFTNNHFVYIWYILKPELADGTRISRFRVLETNPPRADLQ